MDQATQEKAIRLAWTLGKLDYMKLPLQKKFDADHIRSLKISRIFPLEAARRSSKSSWGYIKFNELARQKAGTHYAFVAPVAKGLEQYIEKIRQEVLKDCPADLRPKFNANKLVDKFPNGSSITFAGSDNKTFQHLRGNKFNGALIDEAGFHSNLVELIDDILLPALFDSNGFLMLTTTPPDSPDHPWDPIFDAGILGGYAAAYNIWDTHYSKERIEEWARQYAIRSGLYKPGMSLEELTALGMKTVGFRREMLCERVIPIEKLIIPEWKKEYEMEWKDPVFWKFYHKYESLDSGAGVMDFTAGLLAHYDFKQGWLVIEDEVGPLKGEEVRTDFLANQIRASEAARGYKELHRRVADNNNKILIQDLAGIHKLPFMPARKDDLIAMVNQARLWVSAGRVRVHPRCKYLLGCLKNGVWNNNRDDWAHTMTWGHFDALAALIYLIRIVDVVTNPIPRDFGLDTQTHHIPPGMQLHSQNYEALRGVLKLQTPQRTTDDWRHKDVDPEWWKRFFKKPTN
jgi:uncharacterized protein YihD (DUF1040 family)